MGENQDYYISCWNCSASFNVMEETFCSHSDPTVLCPYCFKCSCNAPEGIRAEMEKNAPPGYFIRKNNSISGRDRRLGEILLNSGRISEEELRKAIGIRRSSDKRLGEILIELGFLNKDELDLYLLGQRSREKIGLKDYSPDAELLERVGVGLCLKNDVIPLEYFEIDEKKILKIAVISPESFIRLKEKKELNEYMLIPCYGEKKEVEEVMKKIKHYAEIREPILLK